MRKLGFSPDEFTLGSVLRACAALKALSCGSQVQCYAVKSGFELNLIVGSALARPYMRCKIHAQSWQRLDKANRFVPDVIKTGATSVVAVISSLISLYSRCGCLDDSEKAFMERSEADVVLWSSMIAAYGFHGQGDKAIKLFKKMEQEGL
ncbi:hypothetical protein Nepgr_013362 [Nepenthes gracilis]|uniref:Pentatricopeptide repeat-containing protein n=1 Tax=Nepenthes gracilis TaxID=150966 RepID=A0AAD3XP88_NEPGR|nr:hypothetical protein Nepgr_013362 [Nepenthes gracilis]